MNKHFDDLGKYLIYMIGILWIFFLPQGTKRWIFLILISNNPHFTQYITLNYDIKMRWNCFLIVMLVCFLCNTHCSVLVDVDYSSSITGRVTLLGDAAFPASPFQGRGQLHLTSFSDCLREEFVTTHPHSSDNCEESWHYVCVFLFEGVNFALGTAVILAEDLSAVPLTEKYTQMSLTYVLLTFFTF